MCDASPAQGILSVGNVRMHTLLECSFRFGGVMLFVDTDLKRSHRQIYYIERS